LFVKADSEMGFLPIINPGDGCPSLAPREEPTTIWADIWQQSADRFAANDYPG
jgi:hypothetical protein